MQAQSKRHQYSMHNHPPLEQGLHHSTFHPPHQARTLARCRRLRVFGFAFDAFRGGGGDFGLSHSDLGVWKVGEEFNAREEFLVGVSSLEGGGGEFTLDGVADGADFCERFSGSEIGY